MKKLKIFLFAAGGFLFLFCAVMLGFFMLAEIDTAKGSKIDFSRISDGVFTGHYRSGPNRAEVEVTVKAGRISNIKVIRNVASWIGKPASELIPMRILEAQSTDVDAVTGATRSSVVIMNAVNAALQESYKIKEEITD